MTELEQIYLAMITDFDFSKRWSLRMRVTMARHAASLEMELTKNYRVQALIHLIAMIARRLPELRCAERVKEESGK